MYLDRQTATEQAEAIQDILDWISQKYRKIMGLAPDTKMVFLDTETTGLKAGKDAAEIIEVALIVEYPNGRVDHWATKIKPQHIETAHPKALEINGYTPEKWVNAVEPALAAEPLAFILKDATLVGHNIQFDCRFLDLLFEDCGVSFKASELPQIDTQNLVKDHLKPLGLRSGRLTACCEFFGWDYEFAHTAEVDTENTRRLYHMLKSPSKRQKRAWASRLKKQASNR